MTKPVLFAGPSMHHADLQPVVLGAVELRPPAKRGSIEELVLSKREPHVIIVADGVFRACPAVGHREILLAIDAGFQVWGVSSMGAIRAYELRNHGMYGFGYVYQQFFLHEDFTDDELTLLHAPMPPYWPISEALINMRYSLANDEITSRLHPDSVARIIETLKSMYYGARTLGVLQELICTIGGLADTEAKAFVERSSRNRIKTTDLVSLLQLAPWNLDAFRRSAVH